MVAGLVSLKKLGGRPEERRGTQFNERGHSRFEAEDQHVPILPPRCGTPPHPRPLSHEGRGERREGRGCACEVFVVRVVSNCNSSLLSPRPLRERGWG